MLEIERKEKKAVSEKDVEILKQIEALILASGNQLGTIEGDLVIQMIQTSLRLLSERHSLGQLKVINRAMKEMRYAYRVFNQYTSRQVVSIFGSARTPDTHPDYHAARDFGIMMSDAGWLILTGAADGIMKAGLEGAAQESGLGLAIYLPNEVTTNSLLSDLSKVIRFRYFFTRKLMFISHSHAVVAFPGGVGTHDELFEMLTLVQTGKANIVPIVLVDGSNGGFWKNWEDYLQKAMLSTGWISPEDKHLYVVAKSPAEAARHIQQFYRVYHSSRYVNESLVLRIKKSLNAEQIAALNEEFGFLCQTGGIEQRPCLPEENEYVEFPRIVFHHTRRKYGMVRKLIDRLNEF